MANWGWGKSPAAFLCVLVLSAASSCLADPTWSIPTMLNANDTGYVASAPHVAASGQLSLVAIWVARYSPTDPSRYELRYSRSTDSGTSWSTSRLLTAQAGTATDAGVWTDNQGGWLVAWSFNDSSTTSDRGIWCCRSTNDAQSWSTPIHIYMPGNSGSSDVRLVSMDHRSGTTWKAALLTENKALAVSTSFDGGNTWSVATGLPFPNMDPTGEFRTMSGDGRGNWVSVWDESSTFTVFDSSCFCFGQRMTSRPMYAFANDSMAWSTPQMIPGQDGYTSLHSLACMNLRAATWQASYRVTSYTGSGSTSYSSAELNDGVQGPANGTPGLKSEATKHPAIFSIPMVQNEHILTSDGAGNTLSAWHTWPANFGNPRSLNYRISRYASGNDYTGSVALSDGEAIPNPAVAMNAQTYVAVWTGNDSNQPSQLYYTVSQFPNAAEGWDQYE